MDKKKTFKNLIAGLIVGCVLQTGVMAAQTQVNTKSSSLKPAINSSTTKTLKPKQQRKIEIYTDSAGNQISKQQKERTESLKKIYKGVTKEERLMEAMELMKGGLGDFSRKAILGNNLSGKPMIVNFEDLSKFGQAYANFDALGWKKKDRLYIYINKKHQDAPAPALAAVLSHEALHQDDFNSLNEETYAWTLEAAVWTQLSEKDPKYNDSMHPLVVRENTLKKLFIKGNYTSKFIRKTVFANPGYSNLPSRSPGFEDDNL